MSKMIAGQTPYTPEEERKLYALMDAAMDDDPGEEYEHVYIRENQPKEKEK